MQLTPATQFLTICSVSLAADTATNTLPLEVMQGRPVKVSDRYGCANEPDPCLAGAYAWAGSFFPCFSSAQPLGAFLFRERKSPASSWDHKKRQTKRFCGGADQRRRHGARFGHIRCEFLPWREFWQGDADFDSFRSCSREGWRFFENSRMRP